MPLSDYKELFIWNKALSISVNAYKFTSKLPKHETYGIASQIQRAAVSIPSNIAEGYNRKNRKEYLQFLYIASGSTAELETQVLICKDIYKELQNVPTFFS